MLWRPTLDPFGPLLDLRNTITQKRQHYYTFEAMASSASHELTEADLVTYEGAAAGQYDHLPA